MGVYNLLYPPLSLLGMETTTFGQTISNICPIPLLARDDPSVTVNGRSVSKDNPIPPCPICTTTVEVSEDVSSSDGSDTQYATNVQTVTTTTVPDNSFVSPVNTPTLWREEWKFGVTGGIVELWLCCQCEQMFGSAQGCTFPTRYDLRQD